MKQAADFALTVIAVIVALPLVGFAWERLGQPLMAYLSRYPPWMLAASGSGLVLAFVWWQIYTNEKLSEKRANFLIALGLPALVLISWGTLALYAYRPVKEGLRAWLLN